MGEGRGIGRLTRFNDGWLGPRDGRRERPPPKAVEGALYDATMCVALVPYSAAAAAAFALQFEFEAAALIESTPEMLGEEAEEEPRSCCCCCCCCRVVWEVEVGADSLAGGTLPVCELALTLRMEGKGRERSKGRALSGRVGRSKT
jgi:hypothetical protein